jgi:hypothetical protein
MRRGQRRILPPPPPVRRVQLATSARLPSTPATTTNRPVHTATGWRSPLPNGAVAVTTHLSDAGSYRAAGPGLVSSDSNWPPTRTADSRSIRWPPRCRPAPAPWQCAATGRPPDQTRHHHPGPHSLPCPRSLATPPPSTPPPAPGGRPAARPPVPTSGRARGSPRSPRGSPARHLPPPRKRLLTCPNARDSPSRPTRSPRQATPRKRPSPPPDGPVQQDLA